MANKKRIAVQNKVEYAADVRLVDALVQGLTSEPETKT